MARRPRRRHRSKTISGTGVTGQKGVNLIERVVLDMESLWTPTGALEVGIDGYIELFDPETRKPLGLTLGAQSKVASAIGKDSSPTFDFWCEPADVEYWLAGSMPIILIVSNPASNEAYWVSVKEYFKGWVPGNSTTVTFKKSEQRFDRSSFPALAAIAAPKAGFYLAPPRKAEKLHSNLLRVDAFPERICFADTECRWPSDVWALLRKSHHDPDAGWVLKGKRFISFHDLSEEPWTAVCDEGTVESFPTTDWSESSDPERQHVFVQLLNQTLRAAKGRGALLVEGRVLRDPGQAAQDALSVIEAPQQDLRRLPVFEHLERRPHVRVAPPHGVQTSVPAARRAVVS